MKSYIIVFHGDGNKPNKMVDISDDPCFLEPPTWGICRPTTRKSIKVGDYLFFVAYYKVCNQYYFKGYFKVGQKIPYNIALKKFKNRLNVIITNKKINFKNHKWRYNKLKKAYNIQNGQQIKKWLRVLKATEGTFFQNQNDSHEIDNWKCRRIFHCDSDQFLKCNKKNKCLKENQSLKNYSNYIVADKNEWADLGSFWIDFPYFRKCTGFSLSISTPLNQHNVLRCDEYQSSFIDFINKYV
jgi:hypothetical protein